MNRYMVEILYDYSKERAKISWATGHLNVAYLIKAENKLKAIQKFLGLLADSDEYTTIDHINVYELSKED